MTEQEKQKLIKVCATCEHCVYICEGDYLCEETNHIVYTDYGSPTKYNFKCKGKRWKDAR